MTRHDGRQTHPFKSAVAIIGGSAVVALAVLSVAIGRESGAQAMASTMKIGATSTQTTPSAAPATAVAKPTIKGPAPLPSEEAAAK